MKLPLLLSHYLREHQLLRLPGLGSFRYSGQQQSVQGDAALPAADIRFEYGGVQQADDSLIDFIKQNTGKIKPLAIADLNSYIENGLQLLNIGKPFYIEGVGTVQKGKEGRYEFVARELVITNDQKGNEKTEQTDKKRSVFDDEKYAPSVNPWQKIIVALLIVGGLAIVVLGGYFLYNQNNGAANLQEIKQNIIPPAADSTNLKTDSLSRPQTDSANTSVTTYASLNPGAYKFILETTNNKKRALKRYNQLKSYFIDIKMESIDSSAYKLYFLIPATAADTTRIKDSLSRYYTSKVRVEL
ncbi:MAG: hypothetical protein WCF67_20055 [Chitinophagaceae bacterium]